MGRQRLGGVQHKAEIGLALAGQRRRHAQQDRIGLAEPGHLAGRGESFRLPQCGNALAADVTDVGLPGIEPRHLDRIEIEAEHPEATLGDRSRQRQSDVTQADDADFCRTVAETSGQRVDIGRRTGAV